MMDGTLDTGVVSAHYPRCFNLSNIAAIAAEPECDWCKCDERSRVEFLPTLAL
jgi:hypothetical protein